MPTILIAIGHIVEQVDNARQNAKHEERKTRLGEYEAGLLDQMIAITAASALIAYVLYTTSSETELRFGTQLLGLTIPFPVYGIFRYLYLVHRRDGGGSPIDLLLLDRPLLACVTLWALLAVSIIYRLVPLASAY